MNCSYTTTNNTTTYKKLAPMYGVSSSQLASMNPSLPSSSRAAIPNGMTINVPCTKGSTGTQSLGTAMINQLRQMSTDIQSLTAKDTAQAQTMTASNCQSMLKKIMDKLGPINVGAGETLSVTTGPINLIGGVNDWVVTFKSNSSSLLKAIAGAIPEKGTYNAAAGTLSYPIDRLYRYYVDAQYCIAEYGNFNLSY